MPVSSVIVLDKGWKCDENGRFGPAVVLRFFNPADGVVLFEFAPTLSDQPVFMKLFEDVYAVDDLNSRHLKQVKELQVRQEKELRELCDRLKLKADPYFKAISGESFKSASQVGCKS